MKTFLDCGNWLEISLPCGKIVLLSKEDLWIAEMFPSWRYSGGYCKIVRYIEGEFFPSREEGFLHRLIIKQKNIKRSLQGFEVDHINRNKLDNRRENLRLVTKSQNAMNVERKKKRNPYRGVTFRPRQSRQKPWWSYTFKDGKQISLGSYKTAKEAALAYNKKSKEIWGDFAYQNVI